MIEQYFLIELLKGCLTSKTILEICIKYLEYHFLPNKNYKAIFEKIVRQYELTGTIPTIGVLAQYFNEEEEIIKILHQIKGCSIVDKTDIILDTFQKFIANSKFVNLYTETAKLYEGGNIEKAISLLEKGAVEVSNFSIKKTMYKSVFGDFEKRQLERQANNLDFSKVKVPWSIAPLDYYSRGGINKGTSALIMAPSGGGKSTMLRWVGMSAARLGYKVLHFQNEGSEQECLDAYDAGWTGISLENIEFGDIPDPVMKKVQKALNDIRNKMGDVYVYASGSFDELSINDCLDIKHDVIKNYGNPDLIIFDYLETFTLKGKYYNSEGGERKRRIDIANKITNIATEKNYECAALAATQAMDIKPIKLNDPDFVMTRSDISEFKGLIRPFSQFITVNQTEAERDAGISRLHNDKFRKYKSGQTYKIAQSLDNSRFYDSQRTLDLFWDITLNKPKMVNELKGKK